MIAIEIRDGSQIAEARRVAVGLATSHGYDESDAGRVAIVATELATNIIRHGQGGSLLVASYDDETGSGIECVALDKGPGMADVPASMCDGHSTAGGMGTGLGAIARGSRVIDIQSTPGMGTAVLARVEAGRPTRAEVGSLPHYGAINVPMPGEDACGDAWCRKDVADGFTVMVADGLGHGPFASEAAHAASRSFFASDEVLPSAQLIEMHAALRPTRGAAVGIVRVDRQRAQIVYAGVGNIAASIVDADGGVRRMVSHNGTVGHNARTFRDFSYPLLGSALLVLTSDGVATGWRLDAYPGLTLRHPTLIAAVLYRDFSRGRDDATIFVARV